jgi:hypothetical protein
LSLYDTPTPNAALKLLRALAPSRPVQLKAFMGALDRLGADEVQALAESLGPGLKKLVLQSATLTADFWPALLQHLPGLTSLTIRHGYDLDRCQLHHAYAEATDLLKYCKAAQAPLEVRLGEQLFDQLHGDQLQSSLRSRGVHHVTVSVDDAPGCSSDPESECS